RSADQRTVRPAGPGRFPGRHGTRGAGVLVTGRPDTDAAGPGREAADPGREAADRQRLETLRSEIEGHNRRYYIEDAPAIPDAQYDRLTARLPATGPAAADRAP